MKARTKQTITDKLTNKNITNIDKRTGKIKKKTNWNRQNEQTKTNSKTNKRTERTDKHTNKSVTIRNKRKTTNKQIITYHVKKKKVTGHQHLTFTVRMIDKNNRGKTSNVLPTQLLTNKPTLKQPIIHPYLYIFTRAQSYGE